MSENGHANDDGHPPSAAVTGARNRLAPFLQANRHSEIVEIEPTAGQKMLVIARPWGDRSLALRIDGEELIAALNALLLPPRYSGVWHTDTKDFEILWTAFKPPPRAVEIVGRKWKFKFRGKQYECEFGTSSKRVLSIAGAFLPVAPSESDHRNLFSFSSYVDHEPDYFKDQLGDPLSFWIRNVDWDEDEVFALVAHLNFYITYFDGSSPYIRIHSPPTSTAYKRPTRYPSGTFPKHISAMEIDAALLLLWEAAEVGEPTQRFLYYYRILEYASAVYLDSTARSALRIALALPNALDDLTAVTESVVAAVQKMKMDEVPRYETMMREIIDPKLLWRELGQNLAAFTSETKFDGGFTVAPLLAATDTEASFTIQDVTAFARTIRDIRNALSHGRDQKTGTTITPTSHNIERIVPWVGPIRLTASQVILYKGVF